MPEKNNETLTKAGKLLIDSQSGKVVAADCIAESLLRLLPEKLDQATLHGLFPELSEAQLAFILDQNSTNSTEPILRSLATDVFSQPVTLQIVKLSGPDGQFLLLEIHPTCRLEEDITHHDALTGLPDRRELAIHHQRWQRMAGERIIDFAVLFMDLDQFKQVNDQFGHTAGDQVLATLAKRWQSCVRDDDLVVRYGGDEFVVLLSGVKTPVEAQPAIARLTESTTQPVQIDGKELKISVTVGLALSADGSGDLQQLIAAADQAMYAAKESK